MNQRRDYASILTSTTNKDWDIIKDELKGKHVRHLFMPISWTSGINSLKQQIDKGVRYKI